VFDALLDPTILIKVVEPGPSVIVIAASTRAQEMLGFEEREIVGRTPEEIRSTGPGSTTPEEYRRVVEGKQPIVRDHTFEVSGTTRVLRIALTPIVDHGAVTHLLATVADITSIHMAEDRARRAETRFGALVQQSSDMTLVFDDVGQISYISPSIEKWLGYTPDEMLGVNIFDYVHPDDREEAIVGVAAQVEHGASPDQTAAVPIRVRHRDGSWRAVEGMMSDLREHADVHGFVANVRDVTERNQAVEALRRSEDRFRSLAESAPIGIILTDRNGDFTYVNRRFKEIFRTDVLEWRDWREVIHSDDRATVQRVMESALLGNEFSLEYRIIAPTGEVRSVHVSAVPQLDTNGAFEGAIGTVEDITERKNFEEHLAHQATHDPLTGLPNRVVFEDRLGQALVRDARSRNGTAVLFLDLDLFKLANDRFGHAAGDRLLTETAARLGRCMRAGDTVARIGGDEFAMVCEGASVAQAEAIAARILETSREPFDVDGNDVYLTASIGIAIAESGTDTTKLMRHADAAMYRAKEGGRGRAVLYRPEHERDDSQLELAGSLRHALDHDELRVHYQPILDVEPAPSSGSKPWCGGSTRSAACSCPRTSSRLPSTPA
jgi:diguanylate cyclase (GGDEF)-like protein/PAS domain S-box-containing protein